MRNKEKAVDQATAIESLYNDPLSKFHYTTLLGKNLHERSNFV